MLLIAFGVAIVAVAVLCSLLLLFVLAVDDRGGCGSDVLGYV